MPTKYIRPTESIDGSTVLDVRGTGVEGRELLELINGSVENSQLFIITTLPNVLKVTQKQFVSLSGSTDEMMHTTDRMFKSVDRNGNIQCVMEVWIDREIDTVDAIEQNMQAVDAEVEMRDREKADSNNLPSDGIIPMS